MSEHFEELLVQSDVEVIEPLISPSLKLPMKLHEERPLPLAVLEQPADPFSGIPATPIPQQIPMLLAHVPITPLPDLPTKLIPAMPTALVSALPTAPLTTARNSVSGDSRFLSNWAAFEKLATLPIKIIKNILYKDTSDLMGPLQEGKEVRYINVFSRAESLTLWTFTMLTLVTTTVLVGWMLWPSNFDDHNMLSHVEALSITMVMALGECIRLAQSAALIFFALRAKDPIPLKPKAGQRIAVLTTIVPGKEPLDLVTKTLQAMKKMKYDGLVDVWILDEGNSPEVKAVCEALAVKHFSRKGIPAFNQPSGPFRAKTKHGNHNSWRAVQEHNYDIVAQMDPDHIPTEDFLLRTIGYFNDPDVGFVVAPQVYGNLAENWIAKGSAILAYVFHGIIQRGGNGYHAPLLIGTNHLYKTACFRQINGYQDCIIEDHLTSMVIFATRNPLTGNAWKGVYTPDILAVGEGPTSFTDFFSQQMRWAYGIWEIATTFSPKIFPHMKRAQRISFTMLQMFYPSVAVSWVCSNVGTIAYILFDMHLHQLIVGWTALWISSLLSSLGLFFWLRRFNLVQHEQKDSGLIGMVLMLMCVPIYTEAALRRLSGRSLAYVVTAKGKLSSGDNIRTFYPHLKWGVILAAILILNLLGIGSTFLALRIWLCFNLSICLSPLLVHFFSRFQSGVVRGKHKQHLASPATTSLLNVTTQADRLPVQN